MQSPGQVVPSLGPTTTHMDNFTLHPFVSSIESNLCNRGYFCNMFQSIQSSLLDNLINWMYVYIIIRPNFVYLLTDPNSLHEQFYTPFCDFNWIKSRQQKLLWQLVVSTNSIKITWQFIKSNGKSLNLQCTTHKM